MPVTILQLRRSNGGHLLRSGSYELLYYGLLDLQQFESMLLISEWWGFLQSKLTPLLHEQRSFRVESNFVVPFFLPSIEGSVLSNSEVLSFFDVVVNRFQFRVASSELKLDDDLGLQQ